jgi:hypothetical protein
MHCDPPPAHAPRRKFDTLFADPRHYRGDCRLLVTAIRRGWLDEAPRAERRALAARFHHAMRKRWATEPAESKPRALFAEVAAMLAMDRDNMAPIHRALRYAWAGQLTCQTTGRPRERWHVADFPNRLDAAAIQRDAERDGCHPLAVQGVTVAQRWEGGERTDTVTVRAWPGRVQRAVLCLVCPRCGGRRMHLYPTRAGVLCRGCARIGYGTPRRRE